MRRRWRWDERDVQAAIEAFVAQRGTTKCPPAFCAPSQADTAHDAEHVAQLRQAADRAEAEKEADRQARSERAKRGWASMEAKIRYAGRRRAERAA